jgi:uncharacterized protein YndB with AHSA1/START domain
MESTGNEALDSVNESVTVDASQERAFYAFAQQMTSWWPRQYTWSGSNLNHIVLEPQEGAHWYEVSESGEKQPDWGRLIAWTPPSRIVLSWMVGAKRLPETDASHASEVEVHFIPEGPERTQVKVEHRGFKNHGGAWESYRDGMASDDGWRKILTEYSHYVGHQEGMFQDVLEKNAS